jgi:hypothetical protein
MTIKGSGSSSIRRRKAEASVRGSGNIATSAGGLCRRERPNQALPQADHEPAARSQLQNGEVVGEVLGVGRADLYIDDCDALSVVALKAVDWHLVTMPRTRANLGLALPVIGTLATTSPRGNTRRVLVGLCQILRSGSRGPYPRCSDRNTNYRFDIVNHVSRHPDVRCEDDLGGGGRVGCR